MPEGRGEFGQEIAGKKSLSEGSDSLPLPYDGALIDRARDLRKNMTRQERKLWYEFFAHYTPRFQRQKTIGNYIVDFFCSGAGLVVEVDGGQHLSPESLEYDKKRSEFLQVCGLSVVRIMNNDVDENFDGVCQSINETVLEHLPGLPPALRATPLTEGGEDTGTSG